MGIRFLCPNGHKLNVKLELAGKRAICPDCGAKLSVPAVAGQIAGAAAVSTPIHAAAGSQIGNVRMRSVADTGTTAPAAVRPNQSSPAEAESPSRSEGSVVSQPSQPMTGLWYVRPAGGLQYGPATDDVLRAWIAAGRVAADAHIWREGWAEWRWARDVADALPGPLAATVVAAPPPVQADVTIPIEPAPAEPIIAQESTLPATRYVARRSQSRRTQFTLAMLMLVAVVVLAALLIWVIRRNVGQSASTDGISTVQLALSGESPYVAQY